MKGVAILLMIFLHLFDDPFKVDLCKNFIFIGGIPFIHILSRASHPVAFFLIIGGYGLYRVYQKNDPNRFRRILKLYIHWILILTVFVFIGWLFINSTKYPGGALKFIGNASGFDWSYNHTSWFLFPYVILSIFSKYIFKLYSKFRAIYIIIFTIFLKLTTSYLISRHGQFFFVRHYIYDFMLPFHLLFDFSLGVLSARNNWFEKVKIFIKNYKYNQFYAWSALILLIFINCIFKYNFFYAFLIITCISIINLPKLIKKCLIKLGNQSMNMWFIHGWFIYCFFSDFIYSFKYPIVIFVVLTVISYICSLIVNVIAAPIERLFMTKRQVEEKPIL